MRTFSKVLLAVAVAALVASPALAQRRGQGQGQGQRRPGQGGLTFLLENKRFQEELKLTEEQIEKAKKVAKEVTDKHKDDFDKLREAPQEERVQKFMELNRAVNNETVKALGDILKPEQLTRLKQIQLQTTMRFSGPGIFLTEDVEKALKLTAEQKDKVKTIAEDFRKAAQEIRQSAGGNFQEIGRKTQELTKDKMESVQSLLTDDQKKAWKDLVGEPFQLGRPGGQG